MPQVLQDIISHLKQKGVKGFKIYARKGDKVTIISDRWNVVICQKGKDRFPVDKKKLTS